MQPKVFEDQDILEDTPPITVVTTIQLRDLGNVKT